MTRGSPLGAPVQIAYAVADVRVGAARFAAATGAGPFFVVDHIALSSARRHDGVDGFDHSSAYGQWGSMMVELVAEHTPPIVLPESGIHHVAFMVADLAAAAAWCDHHGWPEVLAAETAGAQAFRYHDARAELGHLVELYEPSPRLTGFYAMVAAAANGWDGSEPVRAPG